MVVGDIFCDIQKDFDCVNHSILLTKLEFYEKTGIAYKLIKSYLENRYKSVIFNYNSPDSYSDWGEITRGVPQVSILGPLPFLDYINDLPRKTNDNSKIILFADDTSIIITNPNTESFENCVNKINSLVQLNAPLLFCKLVKCTNNNYTVFTSFPTCFGPCGQSSGSAFSIPC
jgi:hypothetical protein